MKILVTGASGLLGSKIIRIGRKKHQIIGTYLTHPIEDQDLPTEKMDICDKERVAKIIQSHSPDVVIHTAALTNVDYCGTHRQETYRVNVEGTKNVVDACSKVGCKLVYVSTAGIFDGKNAPYDENAEPNPPNYYAWTKLEGEHIATKLANSIIVRTTVPYGWHPWKLNFVTWIIKNLREGKTIYIVTDQWNTPTYAIDFAKAVLRLIELDAKGTFNVVGATSLSRYEFAFKVAEIFELDEKLITPTTTEKLGQVAKRSTNDSLKIDKILSLGIKMSTVEEGLRKMKEEKE